MDRDRLSSSCKLPAFDRRFDGIYQMDEMERVYCDYCQQSEKAENRRKELQQSEQIEAHFEVSDALCPSRCLSRPR